MFGRIAILVAVGSASIATQTFAAASGNEQSVPAHRAQVDDVLATDEPAPDQPVSDQLTIKEVMRYAMTQHLCKKVIKQQASPEEQQRLVELFEALANCKPPIGSEESWNEKTAALVAAAEEVAAGKPAQKSLMEAANCSACHNAHRPK